MILLTIHRKLNQERKDKIGSLQLSILDALQNVYLKTLLYEMDLRNYLMKKVVVKSLLEAIWIFA